MLPQSTLASVRIGLTEFLKTHTGIQWDYYRSLVTPDEGAKGAVMVINTLPASGINYIDVAHEIQLQLLVSHPDHQEAQSLLCDWGELLIRLMKQLARDGLYGLHRGIELEGAMAGCKLADSIKYYVQDSDQRQDIPEGIALGTLQCVYRFHYQSNVELMQY